MAETKYPAWVDLKPDVGDLKRLKVVGGWLIQFRPLWSMAVMGFTFIPDPEHKRPPAPLPE